MEIIFLFNESFFVFLEMLSGFIAQLFLSFILFKVYMRHLKKKKSKNEIEMAGFIGA